MVIYYFSRGKSWVPGPNWNKWWTRWWTLIFLAMTLLPHRKLQFQESMTDLVIFNPCFFTWVIDKIPQKQKLDFLPRLTKDTELGLFFTQRCCPSQLKDHFDPNLLLYRVATITLVSIRDRILIKELETIRIICKVTTQLSISSLSFVNCSCLNLKIWCICRFLPKHTMDMS